MYTTSLYDLWVFPSAHSIFHRVVYSRRVYSGLSISVSEMSSLIEEFTSLQEWWAFFAPYLSILCDLFSFYRSNAKVYSSILVIIVYMFWVYTTSFGLCGFLTANSAFHWVRLTWMSVHCFGNFCFYSVHSLWCALEIVKWTKCTIAFQVYFSLFLMDISCFSVGIITVLEFSL